MYSRKSSVSFRPSVDTFSRVSFATPPPIRHSGAGRMTVIRGASRRESMAHSGNRRSNGLPGNPSSMGSMMQLNSGIGAGAVLHLQHQSNKRGIIKCQLWPIKRDVTQFNAPLVTQRDRTKKYKIEFPQVQETIEYYCPRCDMYFKSRCEYQDHLMLKNFKMPFVNKLRDFHGQTMNNQFNLDFEDDRDKSKFHTSKKERRYYKVQELLDEVVDIRDRARVLRKKRQKTRAFVKSEFTYDVPVQQRRHVSRGRTPSQLFAEMQAAQKKFQIKFKKLIE